MGSATPKQLEYIEQLAIDIGLNTRAAVKDYISIRCGRGIRFLDELTLREASDVITELKKHKESLKEQKAPSVNHASDCGYWCGEPCDCATGTDVL